MNIDEELITDKVKEKLLKDYTVKQSTEGYIIPAKLINTLIVSILGGLLTIAGYMVIWHGQDAAHKREVLTRLGGIERDVAKGILPRADERMKSVERWQSNHMYRHREED